MYVNICDVGFRQMLTIPPMMYRNYKSSPRAQAFVNLLMRTIFDAIVYSVTIGAVLFLDIIEILERKP